MMGINYHMQVVTSTETGIFNYTITTVSTLAAIIMTPLLKENH